jgi:hypothetical protein
MESIWVLVAQPILAVRFLPGSHTAPPGVAVPEVPNQMRPIYTVT